MSVATFLLGVLGGAFGELLKWWNLRESNNWPDYAKGLRYWILTGAMILVGGLLAAAYKIDSSNALLAINVGLSAPLIIKGLAAAVPRGLDAGERDLPKAGGGASLIDFLSGR